MKRFLLSLTAAAALLAGSLAYAASNTTITVSPNDMKDGETKTLVDDGKTIKVVRHGDDLEFTIEGGGKTKHVTIVNGANGEVRMMRELSERDRRARAGRDYPDDGKPHPRRIVVAGPGHEDVIIDGKPLDEYLRQTIPHHLRAGTVYTCPKDHATLRVPDGKDDATYKCPVDGTTMEKRKGTGFSFFFDDDVFTHEL